MALKIVSIGCDWLDDERVEDIRFGSSTTLLGCDVVILDINGEDLTVGAGGSRFKGLPSLDSSTSARLEADIARRRNELSLLLERGATIVLFVPAPHDWYVDTGERQYSGTGRSRVASSIVALRNLWGVFPFSVKTKRAEADDFELVGGEPFATFWRRVGEHMSSAAFMTPSIGTSVLRIRNTDCSVASVASHGSAAIIALPQTVDEGLAGKDFVDGLIELVRALRSDGGDFSQPEWASSFLVGNEAKLAASVDEAQEKVEEALARADSARAELQRLQRRKLLITASGKALEAVVQEALQAIGLAVVEGVPGRTDRIARHPTLGAAVVEVKGKSKSAAEKDSAQLEKWVAAYLEEHEEKAKAILIVNAWRDARLDQRNEAAFPDQMLAYARAREHCLVTGAQLLCAWLEVEAHPERGAEVISDLFASSGRWERYQDWHAWITVSQYTQVETNESA